MIQTLYEIVGLPRGTASAEVSHAAERYSEELFSRSSGGDTCAQRVLVDLQFAYLVWAYAKQDVFAEKAMKFQADALGNAVKPQTNGG